MNQVYKKGDIVVVVNRTTFEAVQVGQRYTILEDSDQSSDWIEVKGVGGSPLMLAKHQVKPLHRADQSDRVQELEQEVVRLKHRVSQLEEPCKDNPLLHEFLEHGREYIPANGYDISFSDVDECLSADQARQDHMQFLRRIAQLNAEQGWVCDWSNRNQKRFAFKTVTNRAYNEYTGREVKYQAYKDTQTLPDYYYMSEKTAKIIYAEYTQEQLINIIQKGALGI